MVNELPLENYLCKVVPSEMPASYQKEALKAQAICARSYAYRQIMDYAYPEYQAHVNDSTDYQVYNNSASQQAATEAVQETAGKVLKYNGNIITAYYYSTSCGKTTTMAAWGTKEKAENAYLQSVEVKDQTGDYERNLPMVPVGSRYRSEYIVRNDCREYKKRYWNCAVIGGDEKRIGRCSVTDKSIRRPGNSCC